MTDTEQDAYFAEGLDLAEVKKVQANLKKRGSTSTSPMGEFKVEGSGPSDQNMIEA